MHIIAMLCLSSKFRSWKNIKSNSNERVLNIQNDADVKYAIQLIWPTATTNVLTLLAIIYEYARILSK